ncbi:MAG: hypothetical protein ACRDTE_10740 [Pseudonocardiaceae bacterium]
MRTPVTLLSFFIGLILLFGVAISLGEVVGGGASNIPGGGSGSGEQGPGHDDGSAHKQDEKPGGLSVADQGYVLWPAATRFPSGETSEFTFTIFTVDRAPVTDFALDHDKRMHMVLVRRDMTEYQHLHPTMDPDGTWTVRLRLDEPGSYRAFATFRPGKAAEPVTLGVDLESPGLVEPQAVSQPSELTEVDEYTVMLDGTVIAGGVSRLYMTVLRDNESVTDLQPYLGANGHMVMLREGDLGYLHVHPVPGNDAGPTISFEARVPTPGYYRVFLDFQHLGEVRTAEFTVLAS